MNKFLNSLWQILSGLLILATAVIIACSPEGTVIVLIILSIAVFIYAIKQLWLYFTMARFMVGGMRILFEGLIALDFAIFLLSLNTIRATYIMIYLIVVYLATGAIDLFRALEIKKLKDGIWKWKASFGMVNIIISILCLIFIQSNEMLCLIYGIGLAITGMRRIVKAFQKSNVVYIQ